MKPVLTIVTGEDRTLQYLGASVTLAGVSILIGLGAYPLLGLQGFASAAALGLASSLVVARRGLEGRREVLMARRKLEEAAKLLMEGVEAEPGRITLDARYTGEMVPRGYTKSLMFRPTGDPTIVDAEMLASQKPRYTLVARGHTGVLEAEGYRVKLEHIPIYIVMLHDRVALKLSRDRLVVRHGGDYAEASFDTEGPILSCIVSHVGRSTRALLELEVTSPLAIRVGLAAVRGRAEKVILPFAPYASHVLLFSANATPADIASALGEDTAIHGHGIDVRLKLSLRRGMRSLDVDELVARTVHSG